MTNYTGQSCRLPGLYWALIKALCDSDTDNPTDAYELLVKRLKAAEPLTVSGGQLDAFNGPVPTPAQVPMFTDRHSHTYDVNAHDVVTRKAPRP